MSMQLPNARTPRYAVNSWVQNAQDGGVCGGSFGGGGGAC